MSKNSSTTLKIVFCATTMLASASGAWAQDSGAGEATTRAGRSTQLDTITVTARKREESLIDVPVAVSALPAETLERAGYGDLERISTLVPSVSLVGAPSGTGASFTIRGIGTPSLDPGLEQSVLITLDGTPITRGRVILVGMFDLAQIEILKGPQTLFFGKNSPAGVVSISSAKPTRELEGYVRGGYEFEAAEKYVEGAISGPLSETLSARMAFRVSQMDGWLTNVAQPLPSPLPAAFGVFLPLSVPGPRDNPGTKEYMARATVLWEPTSNFDATLRFTYGDYSDSGTTVQQYCDPAVTPGIATPVPGIYDLSDSCKFDDKLVQSGIPVSIISPDWRGVASDGLPYQDLESIFTNLTLNYQAGDITFTSISSYWDIDHSQQTDYDTSSYGLATVPIGELSDSFSQELRMVTNFDSRFNFTFGAFYETVDRESYSDAFIFNVGPDPVTGRFDNFHSENFGKAKTYSAFGQVRIALTDQIEIAGGVRYTKEKRDQISVNRYFNANADPALGPFVTAGAEFVGDFEDTNWSPEATISYKPTDDLMLYGAFKTGYKSGGFPSASIFKYFPNPTMEAFPAPAGAVVPAGYRFPQESDIEFGPEKVKGGEVGFKAQLADRRVRIEGTAYLYDYKDLQQSVFNPETFSFAIFNAANARVKGVELQGEWAATPDLRLNGAVAFNDAKFRSYPNGSCWPAQTPATGCVGNFQDLTGTRLPRAPKWEMTGGASYETPVSPNLMFGISTDVSYRSSYKTQENQAPFAVQDAFALLNAGARVFTADNRWELAFIGRNLTEKYYVGLSTNTAFAATQDQVQNPTPRGRELKVQGTFRF